ncbi:hypothetical protein [Paenibacillus sp. GbtcB18]|uniref:hypothetical protein n=1 Tax=Paenibacillus sp. GbtcB18 TaxID=2824763 RepID=UPI001C304FC5|nr:hypothetical protein [Paenibacillus sp. GbtcB18]
MSKRKAVFMDLDEHPKYRIKGFVAPVCEALSKAEGEKLADADLNKRPSDAPFYYYFENKDGKYYYYLEDQIIEPNTTK